MGIRQRAPVVVELTPEDCELLSGELAAALANARRVAPVGQRVQALAEDVAGLARVAHAARRHATAADQRISGLVGDGVDGGGADGSSSQRSSSVAGSSRRLALSVADVATQMGVSRRHIRHLATTEGIGRKVNDEWRFTADDVELIRDRRRAAASAE